MMTFRRRCGDGHHNHRGLASCVPSPNNTKGRGGFQKTERTTSLLLAGLLRRLTNFLPTIPPLPPLPTITPTMRITSCCCPTGTTEASKHHVIRSFWILGLLNNTPWVLMLAVATHISAGGVALVVSPHASFRE